MDHSVQEDEEMHAIVKGNVQGVGFRALTQYCATKLGITGTVKNLEDGTVEIYAQGSRKKLEELMKTLQTEAGKEKFKEASIKYFPITKPYKDFRILHSW